MEKNIKIKQKDWNYLQAALITYTLAPFESSSLQDKVKDILRKIK